MIIYFIQCLGLSVGWLRCIVRKLNNDKGLHDVSFGSRLMRRLRVRVDSKTPLPFATHYLSSYSSTTAPSRPAGLLAGLSPKQLAHRAAKRIYQSKWCCKPRGRRTLCGALEDISGAAQAGAQVRTLIAVVFIVCVCASVCLHTDPVCEQIRGSSRAPQIKKNWVLCL